MDITGPRCILVLGTHRTGTSLVAGILHHLGVNMGDEMKPAHPTNPAGHFEDMDFLALNDKVVGNWQSPREDLVSADALSNYEMLVRQKTSTLWGIKDPRLCITAKWILPFLYKYGNDVRVIATHRREKAIYASLRTRNPITLQKAEWITETYIWSRHRFHKSFPGKWMPIYFEELTDLDRTIGADNISDIIKFVFEGLPAPDEQQVADAVAHIDPSLRHY